MVGIDPRVIDQLQLRTLLVSILPCALINPLGLINPLLRASKEHLNFIHNQIRHDIRVPHPLKHTALPSGDTYGSLLRKSVFFDVTLTDNVA